MSSYFPTYFLRGDSQTAGTAAGRSGIHAWSAVAGAPFEISAHAAMRNAADTAGAAAAAGAVPAETVSLAEAAAR